MTPWEKVLSWYHSSEFEELRIADNVQRMAAAAQEQGGNHIYIVCPQCRHTTPVSILREIGGCLWCGWKPRPFRIWS